MEFLPNRLNGGAMPDQLSAWQLILNGDPTLFAIVRLSLVVSLPACPWARCWH
jgi:hypothetical protein